LTEPEQLNHIGKVIVKVCWNWKQQWCACSTCSRCTVYCRLGKLVPPAL